ncbi:unnamed protein product, partial [Porites lobata]
FVEEFCQLCEKKMETVERKRKIDRDLYVVEVVKVDTTRKQLKIHFVEFSHEYDEWRDYDNKWNYFPFISYFEKERQYSAENSVFSALFYRKLRPPDVT